MDMNPFFKFGQVVGCGTCLFVGVWLILNPEVEPREKLRLIEIFVSLLASGILAINVFRRG